MFRRVACFGALLMLVGAALLAPAHALEPNSEPAFFETETSDADSRIELVGAADTDNTSSEDSLGSVLSAIWRDAPQVQRAQAELAATGFEVSGARSGYFPYITVLGAQGDRDRTQATASLVQPLWDGGRTSAEVSETKLLRSRAQARLDAIRMELAQDAAEAYFDIAVADEATRLIDQYTTELQSLQGLIERRAEQGAAAQADIELARVRVQQSQASAAANVGRQLAARSELAVLLSRRIASAQWPGAGAAVSDADVAAYQESGIPLEHPDRLVSVFEMQADEARGRIARAALWPRLSAQHVQQLEQQRGDLTPDSATQLVIEFQTDNQFRAWRGHQAQARRIEGAQQLVIQTERQIADRIESAQALSHAAKLQFEVQSIAAESSRLLVESYLRQFKGGRKSWLEVLNVRREAHDAALQALGAKRDYWTANVRLALQSLKWERIGIRNPDAPNADGTTSADD